MELGEKLQELRKQRGLTQEELASALFVSRTAVSKWESGRGCPGIQSLQALAAFFGLTVDELLSGEELLQIARQETREKESHFRDLVFGLLDAATAMLFFLPFFALRGEPEVRAVSLLTLSARQGCFSVIGCVLVGLLVTLGVLTLALQNQKVAFWCKCKRALSLILGAVIAGLCILCLHPYAAIFLCFLLGIKLFLLRKNP